MDNCAKLWFKGIRYELEQVNWHVWWSSYDKKWKARISYLISLIISTLFFLQKMSICWVFSASWWCDDMMNIIGLFDSHYMTKNITRITYAVQFHSKLSGNKDHHEFGIVRIVIRITVPNVTRNGREVFWSGRVSSSLWSNNSKITSLWDRSLRVFFKYLCHCQRAQV